MSLRGKAAVVGVAESDLGEVGAGFTPLDLIGQATFRALKDAGLEKSDVDGLFSASAYYHMPTLSVGEYLGIRPRYSDATSMGGSSFVSHLLHAAAAIDAGLAEVAVAAREWAKLNPKAFMREDLTVEDVLFSRMVSSPLSVRNCCLVTDGGGAAIVTSAERARDLEVTPV